MAISLLDSLKAPVGAAWCPGHAQSRFEVSQLSSERILELYEEGVRGCFVYCMRGLSYSGFYLSIARVSWFMSTRSCLGLWWMLLKG